MRAIPKLVLAAVVLAAPAAQAADVAGAKDHASIKRYEGSEIINQKTRNYDEYILALGAGAPGTDFEKSQKLEGKLQRTTYRVPAGHTTIEITRNYEQALKDAGFEILHLQQADNFSWYGYFANRFYLQALTGLSGGETNPVDGSVVRQARYIAAKRTVADQDVYAAVLVVESLGTEWVYEPNMKGTSIKVKPGEILVALDVIETKHVENKMVEIKSEEMAKALAEKGSVDIYGIYFDTDKTDLKPESAPTLEEVAKLLKGDTALKLQVAGHTDNTGTKEHNQKLSEGRAKAVVTALTGQYAIDAGRLESKGYGDSKPVASNDTKEGKAKNRRVELVKI